jgi:predicted dehydrogenase
MTKIAFLGAAHIHTPGFINSVKKRTDLTSKYVWDHDAERAEKRAAELSATPTQDLDTVLGDSEISTVIVCSETDRHAQLVLPAAAAKKNLFVEKPLGYAGADAYQMAEAIEKAGVLFQTGYFMRGDPKVLYLKEQVAAGAFGKITRVRGSNCHGGALGRWFDTEWRWMADPKIAGCGGFGDLGTHSLDILLWLFGEVEKVTAQLDTGTNAYDGCDETGEGILRFKSGTIGTLAAAWDDVANPASLIISGTEGHAAIINGKLHFQSKHVPGMDGSQPVRDAELPKGWPHGFDNFLDATQGNAEAASRLVTVREAAYRSAVMEALYTGAREDRWVSPAAPL